MTALPVRFLGALLLLLVLGKEEIRPNHSQVVFLGPITHAMSDFPITPMFPVGWCLEIRGVSFQQDEDVSVRSCFRWRARRKIFFQFPGLRFEQMKRRFGNRCGQVRHDPMAHLGPDRIVARLCIWIGESEGEGFVLGTEVGRWKLKGMEREYWALGDGLDGDVVA